MDFWIFAIIVAAALSLVTAGLWLCFALWLRLGPKPRGLLSLLIGQLFFAMFLLVDGAPFNGVIFAIFLLPLIALQTFIIVVLEARGFQLRE